MSDLMLLGVLRMPMPQDPQEIGVVEWIQFCSRARQAADRIEADAAEISKLQARNAALVEALTPSGETKAAYMGEFSFADAITDEDGNEVTVRVMVPWTTVKEIMAAIRARAAITAARGK